MHNARTSSTRWFRILGALEGISFLLLLGIAMPLKYLLDMPGAVSVIGAAHGGLFVGFLLAAAFLAVTRRWSFWWFAGAVVASVLPFGPFVYDARLRRLEQAAGR